MVIEGKVDGRPQSSGPHHRLVLGCLWRLTLLLGIEGSPQVHLLQGRKIFLLYRIHDIRRPLGVHIRQIQHRIFMASIMKIDIIRSNGEIHGIHRDHIPILHMGCTATTLAPIQVPTPRLTAPSDLLAPHMRFVVLSVRRSLLKSTALAQEQVYQTEPRIVMR